jgi:hypothetical protein
MIRFICVYTTKDFQKALEEAYSEGYFMVGSHQVTQEVERERPFNSRMIYSAVMLGTPPLSENVLVQTGGISAGQNNELQVEGLVIGSLTSQDNGGN